MQVWIEKYRPKKLDDIVGQEDTIKGFKSYVAAKDTPHLLFSGPPGTAKTTAALCLARELFGDEWSDNFMELNASVSKNTPILIKRKGEIIERVDFDYLDRYYNNNIEDIEVLTVGKDLKVKWSKINRLIKHKTDKLLKITYEGGTIEVTGNHSVIVFDDKGNLVSKNAGDLKVGDYLISFASNIEDDNVIENVKCLAILDEDTSWLYGIYRSEGCLGDNVLVFSLGSHERGYIDRIRQIAETKLKINTSERLCGSGFGGDPGNNLSETQIRLFYKWAVPFFRYYFYEKHSKNHTAHTKRVPYFIFGNKIKNKLSYLRGEYEGDGADLWKRKQNVSDDDTFRVTSVSRNSLVDLAWLGRTSGLHTSIYPEDNVIHLLFNSFKSDLLPGDTVINLISQISKSGKLKYNWTYDLRHLLYRRKDTKKGINNRIAKQSLNRIDNKIICDNKQIDLFGERTVDENVTKFRTLLRGDLHIIEIKKIEIKEYFDFVYDVSVPENQMFFAGDIPILLHNSDERGIDIVRGKIKNFAMSAPIGDAEFKIIFLDEADALTNDAQSALRRTMEKYTNVCRFILSCNYSSKIIEPIQSRCAIYKFKRISDNAIIERINYIIKNEGLDASPNAVQAIKYVAQGDMRRAINALQAAAMISRKIDPDMIYKTTSMARPEDITNLIMLALEGNFAKAHAKMNYLLNDEGLAGTDITGQIYREIFNINIPDKLKVELIDYIGDIDFRISEGSNERLQLGTLISKFILYGINKK